MKVRKEKSKKIIMLASLATLSGCAYFRENPDELKKFESSVETQIDVGMKAKSADIEEKE